MHCGSESKLNKKFENFLRGKSAYGAILVEKWVEGSCKDGRDPIVVVVFVYRVSLSRGEIGTG